VRDEKEFNTDFLDIVEKLKQSGEYRSLFASAYPEHPQYQISKWSISNALACYVADLRSFNSPFDQYVRGEREAIAAEVERGFDLFMGKANCGTCHFAPAFNGTVPPYFQESESEVLGVPAAAHGPDSLILDPDPGRFASYKPIDQTPFYLHSFKTVTVRNAALTAPYMHNGIYHSLEEVVDFYNKGGGAGMGIEVPYQTLPDTPLELSEQEVQDLVAFMEALTDTTGMTVVPAQLPAFETHPEWNKRRVGGTY
jgi:cytochrome c peroxidase